LGDYEHADILERMIDRDPKEATGHIFAFLRQAIEYKLNGHDFEVHFQEAYSKKIEITWDAPVPDGVWHTGA
jgi:hypothetical protein